MEPFKNYLNAQSVRDMATHLQRVWPAFDTTRFSALAATGLDTLEFKARARHLGDALAATLPADFAQAASLLVASLGPPGEGDELSGLRTTPLGLAGWPIWPMTEYIARHGLDDPARGLEALHAMTQRFSAEWAIRPYVERHPALTFDTLQRWTADPSAHVRRLVSEGSRPRLPWGMQLRALIADPSPTLPLLEALQDDPSAYVRRSVANHLNDIAKDHPGLVADWLERHLPGAPAARRSLLRHASRSLIKQGERRVLAAWGLGAALRGTASVHITPGRVVFGDGVTITATLESNARRAQTLVVDYVVHHVKANGGTSPKVFKGWNLTLAPGEAVELVRRHALKPITTRRYFGGVHRVELQVNGSVVADAAFELQLS